MASATVGGDSVQTTCSGPASAMIIHNPKDNLAPFSGAEAVRKLRLETNSCSWNTENTGPSELKCMTYTGCAGGTTVLWCPHTQDTDERGKFYPHTWPRSTATHMKAFLNSLK